MTTREGVVHITVATPLPPSVRTSGSLRYRAEPPSSLSGSVSSPPGGDMRSPAAAGAVAVWLLLETVEAKKYCWYFESGYPIYFICRSYEDCCGTRCCVRALSIQRLWYFWVLLMMGVLFCCGAGLLIRRRMHLSPLRDETTFNVSFTRHPVSTPVSQQPVGVHGFGVNGMTGGDPAYPALPGSAHMVMGSYPPPPSYCSHPPPPYEQIFQKK